MSLHPGRAAPTDLRIRPSHPLTRVLPLLGCLLLCGAAHAEERALSLAEAEAMALGLDPMAQSFLEQESAYEHRADAAPGWPDPQLRFGFMNLPVDGFSLSDQPMTQTVVGLRQMMPRSGEVRAQRDALLGMGRSVSAQAADRRIMLREQVRTLWTELAYQERVAEVLGESGPLFGSLVDIARATYSVGGRGQQDVLRAELELQRLGEREARVAQRSAELRAALSGLIGDAASGPLQLSMDSELPTGDPMLDQHPQLRRLDAEITAAGAQVRAADARSGPRWAFDLAYGARAGTEAGGGSRPDFLSAMVSVELPLFSDRRQRGELDSAQASQRAMSATRAERLRQLEAQLAGLRATRTELAARIQGYDALIATAERRAEATLVAYRNDNTDFDAVMHASIALLDLRIERERLRADLQRAGHGITYLYAGTEGMGHE